MNFHFLKCWSEYFFPAVQGFKGFEYRKNDRNYQVGDQLCQREFDPSTNTYTGRAALFQVLRVWTDIPGMPDGFCIMETLGPVSYYHLDPNFVAPQ